MNIFGEQKNCSLDTFQPYQRPKLSDGLGGTGGAHGALTNSREARTDGGEAVRCSARLCKNSENTILKNEKAVRITLAKNKNAL